MHIRRGGTDAPEVEESGFTLIEVLVIIIIMGVLASIAVAAVQSMAGSSARTSCKADLKNVEVAVGAFGVQVGHSPSVGDNASLTPDGALLGGGLTNAMNGIEALYAPQIYVADRSTNVGPWLKDAPGNSTHYSIQVSSDGLGKITVTDAAGPNQTDCAGVE